MEKIAQWFKDRLTEALAFKQAAVKLDMDDAENDSEYCNVDENPQSTQLPLSSHSVTTIYLGISLAFATDPNLTNPT